MTLIKSKINSLAWLKSAIYISVVGGVILSSKSVSAAMVEFSLIDVDVSVPELVNPSGTLTPPAVLTFTDLPNTGIISIVGGDFDSDSTVSFGVQGKFWKATFNISQDGGFLNDVLSLNGMFQHINDPHAAEQPGDVFSFNYLLDADNATSDRISGIPISVPKKHLGGSDHSDTFNAELTATVSTTLFADDITGWTFKVTGEHQPVPEPTTIFGSALALGVGGWLKRKKSSRQNKTASQH